MNIVMRFGVDVSNPAKLSVFESLSSAIDRQFDAMRRHLMDRREFRNFEMAGAELSAEQKLFLRAQGLQLG